MHARLSYVGPLLLEFFHAPRTTRFLAPLVGGVWFRNVISSNIIASDWNLFGRSGCRRHGPANLVSIPIGNNFVALISSREGREELCNRLD